MESDGSEEAAEAVENLLESYFMQIDGTYDRLVSIGELPHPLCAASPDAQPAPKVSTAHTLLSTIACRLTTCNLRRGRLTESVFTHMSVPMKVCGVVMHIYCQLQLFAACS